MPSRHSSGVGGGREFESDIEKYLRTKNMRTVLALVDGIRSEEEAREWLGWCNRIGVNEKVKSAVVERVAELSE